MHNFFDATRAAAAYLIECRLTMTRVAVRRVACARDQCCATRENHDFIGVFAFCANIRRNFRNARIPARRAALRCAGHRSILLRAAALTHKIKRSHCYFSPAVVIRLQCGSIRDCTAPRSPSTLRLGGQQWRRREKRRKRQRRPRSVGRRSSQSRNGLRHRMCRGSRHTGPADVEAIDAATGRLRWATGGAGGMRVRAS